MPCLQSNEELSCPRYTSPVEAELGNTCCLLVPALILQRTIFLGLFWVMFFTLPLVISLFKMAPEGQVLSSVSKGPTECDVPQKMCVLGKLYSGTHHSDTGSEFSIKEAAMYLNKVSLNRNTHRTRLSVLTVISWQKCCNTGPQKPNPARSNGSAFANSVLAASSQKRTPKNNKNWLYLYIRINNVWDIWQVQYCQYWEQMIWSFRELTLVSFNY